MKVKLPRGTGSIKTTRPYNTLTANQKLVYDKVYDQINGPIFFAENCCYTNCNGIVQYEPFDYQREMIFNMHHYKSLLTMVCRQGGKCVCGDVKIKIRNKKTKEIEIISIKDFFDRIRK